MTTQTNHKNSLLIVDDEFVVRDSLTKWFRQDGYRVESAEDANKALKLMDQGPCDVVLLDKHGLDRQHHP